MSYYDLGSYCRPVATQSSDTQKWFNRGLIWNYAFNHEASAECFEKAIESDENCPMAYWGLSYTLGPNYNKPWSIFDESDRSQTVSKALQAATKAKELAKGSTQVEIALIDALQQRYPKEPTAENCSSCNQSFAEAMEVVYHQYPNDLDVATIYADALMNLTPWALWDLKTGLPAHNNGARTMEIKVLLERAMRLPGSRQHPGLLHLYIHLMEMSSMPEVALPAADLLRGLVPDAGHLNHMPTHIDVLCGDYRRAISSNSEAIRADEKYLAQAGALNFYSLYRSHNYHFRIYAAMFAGQSAVALSTVDALEKSIPEKLLRIESPPMADWLEGFLATRLHVLVRFGLWNKIIDVQLPNDSNLYCVTTAMTHYAKAVALAAIGKIEKAENQQALFCSAANLVPDSRTLFNNKCKDILKIAEQMLAGEVEYRKANFKTAFAHLEKAIDLDDNLPYDEPWGWMQPTRHAYGALLLEQGYVEKAAKVYSADLGYDNSLPRALQHPNNIWALSGYHECLVNLGKYAEAGIIEQQLKIARSVADVHIQSSCYCRQRRPNRVTGFS